MRYLRFLMLAVSASMLVAAHGESLPDRDLERFVVASKAVNAEFEIVVATSVVGQELDGPLPLLVVLDGFLLGMSAIETARLLTAAGEIEPIIVATVSASGPFAARTARRGPDFSANAEGMRDHPSIQGIVSQLDAAGIKVEQAFGQSDNYRRFVRDEMLPELASRMAYNKKRMSLFGHSAAGAFTLEALLEGDLPFQDFVVGEAGTFMLFGTEGELVAKALAHQGLPAKRLFYADSGDTMTSNTKHLFESETILQRMERELGLTVEKRHYAEESHTTMIPRFLKDSLLKLYGTGHRYSKTFAERMGISGE